MVPAIPMLGLVLLLACGAKVNEFEVIQGTNSQSIKVRQFHPITLNDGRSAIMLSYMPEGTTEDEAAIRQEVASLWNSVRPEVTKNGFPAGLIRASTLLVDEWEVSGGQLQYLFTQDAQGTWNQTLDADFRHYPKDQ